MADQGQHGIDGISRRKLLHRGLLVGAGVATVGALSGVLPGTAKASTAITNPQPDWGWCEYCGTMWWTGGQPHSRCAANGRYEHNYRSGTYNYQIYNGQGGSNQNNPQPNWRWCTLCQGLFWRGSGGSCMGNNQQAHQVGVTDYDLPFNSGITIQYQPYWRWCGRCSLLFWGGSSTGTQAGFCPGLYTNGLAGTGGPHLAGSDTDYCIDWFGTL